ncbi:DoxX family protein [Planosporangium sp. 12N6]|uniref:DoxX family protein n=1 Tax=Planosporangium spinosum TaxID=3402278 RepID=UPI003CEB9CA8
MFTRVHTETLSLYRMVVGLLFLCHGAASMFGVLGGGFGGHAVHVGTWPGWWAALIQLVTGALVLVGLLTRPAALVASGSMAYAYFTVHQERALWPIQNGGELAAMFCWSFLLLAVAGPGRWSLDELIGRVRSEPGRAALVEA